MLSYPCYFGEFFHFTGYNRITLPECFILTKTSLPFFCIYLFMISLCFRLDGECRFTFTTFLFLFFAGNILSILFGNQYQAYLQD